jgi:capsular polysaccharide transport system permease protein
MVAGVFYYGVYLSSMYVSTAKFAVRGGKSSGGGDIMSLLGGLKASSSEAYIVAEYIQSLDMLKRLNSKLDLRDHYSQSGIDYFSRLKDDATLDDILEYWPSVAQVSFDNTTGILTVTVKAYTPEMAQAIVTEVLNQSEELMNRMNDRVEEDTIKLAREEMGLAEARYSAAKKALNEFQLASSDINPEVSTRNRFSVLVELEKSISSHMMKMQMQSQFLNKDSVQMRIQQANLDELQRQLATEKQRLLTDQGPEMLKELNTYESLSIEAEFARNYYIATLKALEVARVQSEGKTIYLEAFQQPTLPEKAAYPDRGPAVLLVIVVVGMGYALLLLVIAAVKEHIGV